jgi:hypothetical protein
MEPMSKTLGEIAFDAYDHANQAYDWEMVERMKLAHHWEAAASAVRQQVIEDCAASCEEDEVISSELERILNIIAKDGFPLPRDPDVAIEAITTLFRDRLRSLADVKLKSDSDEPVQQVERLPDTNI